jgi:hypothetical protein
MRPEKRDDFGTLFLNMPSPPATHNIIIHSKILSINLSSMPDTIDHNCLLLLVNYIYNAVITDAEPIPVLTFQLFGLGMRKRLLLEGEDCIVDLEEVGI